MHPPLNNNNNNGGKPSKSYLFGNYYNDNNPSRPTPSSSSSYDLLPSPIYIPLEDEAVFCDFFQQHFFSNDHNNYHNINILANVMTTINGEYSTMEECSNNNGQVATNDVELENSSPRKRPSKRDRHSKINTAQGPRDRRMRLSLDVAKKLFGLQDLLGFDKASKTVDWLLTKSKTAIQELLPDQSSSFMGLSNSASSTSECEVVSSDPNQEITTKSKTKSCSESSKKPKEKSIRKCPDYHHPVAKATRERARARARERTIEKRNYIKQDGGQDSNFRPIPDRQVDQDVYPLGSWKPVEENQRKSIGQHDQLTSNFQFKQGFVGDSSSGSWSPSYLFNYQHTSGLTHEHQYNDFQIIGKAWDGNSN